MRYKSISGAAFDINNIGTDQGNEQLFTEVEVNSGGYSPTIRQTILLCLTSDDFTHQSEAPWE